MGKPALGIFPISTLSEILPRIPFNRRSNSTPLHRYFSLLDSCSSLRHLLQIHSQLVVSGFHRNSQTTNRIIHYCTSNPANPIQLINHGRRVLHFCANSDPIPWNNVIRVYSTSDSNSPREAIWVFLDMRRLGIEPNEYTFPYVFKSCAAFLGLKEGRQVHGDAIKHGLDSNVYVQNTLIHLYGSCKKMMDAYEVFDKMLHRTLVTWNSIISATVECSWFYNSVELFVKMRNSGFEADERTMVIMLTASAEIGNLSLGKWLHSQVIGKGMTVNCQLGTSLVDMYSKCGDVNYANSVFKSMVHRNVWTWSAMILGFAQHGFAGYAFELFKMMRNNSIKPNQVTFLGVLCACSHAGLVEDGRKHFNDMKEVHGIKPGMLHFGAMVDILGRGGHLNEAYDFIMKMPVEADAVVWRTLLGACNIHDVKDYSGVGKKVRQKLIELEPKRSGNIVMVANSFAESGLWEKAEFLRKKMKEKGMKKKKAGESCLEVSGSVFRFFSGGSSCVACQDLLLLLDTLSLHAKTSSNKEK